MINKDWFGKELKSDLEYLQKNNINIVLFRNYFEEKSAHDIDLLCKKSQREKLYKLIKKRGYKIFQTYFHKVYCHKINSQHTIILHVHFNAYETPFSKFLNIKQVKNHTSKIKNIKFMSPSQQIALYLYKIKTGRSLIKAKKHINKQKDKLNIQQVNLVLKQIFTKKSINVSLNLLKRGEIKKSGNSLKFKSHLFFKLSQLSARFIHKIELIIKPLFHPMEFVVFIGTDGSGKTTTVSNLENFLKSKELKVFKEYGGRFKFKYLPFNKIISTAATKKKKEGQKEDTIRYTSPIVKNLAPFVFYVEYLLRYMCSTFKGRRTHQYVIADRAYVDVIISANTNNKTARFCYNFLPKPSKLFFLYNEFEVLTKRRPEHDPNDIKRQLKAYKTHTNLYSACIKTKNLQQTINDILKELVQ